MLALTLNKCQDIRPGEGICVTAQPEWRRNLIVPLLNKTFWVRKDVTEIW